MVLPVGQSAERLSHFLPTIHKQLRPFFNKKGENNAENLKVYSQDFALVK